MAIGLPEMIADDLTAYEKTAVALAKDPKQQKDTKVKLAKNRDTKSLFDAAAFCTHIEAAYTAMLERSRMGLPPQGFAVDPIS